MVAVTDVVTVNGNTTCYIATGAWPVYIKNINNLESSIGKSEMVPLISVIV